MEWKKPRGPVVLRRSHVRERRLTASEARAVFSGEWRSQESKALAIANFSSTEDPNFLSLLPGDMMKVEQICGEWAFGVNVARRMSGIFPISFVELTFRDTMVCEEDDVVSVELKGVLREWTNLLMSYYKNHRIDEFRNLKQHVRTIMSWFAKIAAAKITPNIQEQLRCQLLAKVEEARRTLGLEIIVRLPDGQRATESNTYVMELFRMHQEQVNFTLRCLCLVVTTRYERES